MLLLACPIQPSSSCVLDLLGRGKDYPGSLVALCSVFLIAGDLATGCNDNSQKHISNYKPEAVNLRSSYFICQEEEEKKLRHSKVILQHLTVF